MRKIKQTLTATILALLFALPLGVHAADQAGATAASTPPSVKESLQTIVSTPLSTDGGMIITQPSATPFSTHETTTAACIWVCAGGECTQYCW